MLTIKIKGRTIEEWDQVNEVFITRSIGNDMELQLEHSLISLSKWESKYHKSLLKALEKGTMTDKETRYYVKCMTMNQKNIPDDAYYMLTNDDIKAVNDYISDPMTATVINSQDNNKAPSRDVITSEVIYYQMLSFGIPFECEKWHLNRLMTLLRVCSVKEGGSKKMSKNDIYKQNAALNAARRSKYHTKG